MHLGEEDAEGVAAADAEAARGGVRDVTEGAGGGEDALRGVVVYGTDAVQGA
jgi:hypothetical protein